MPDPAVYPVLFAVLTLAVVVWTMTYKRSVKPPNPLLTKQPVLDFEFAQTEQDIRTLFAEPNGQPARPWIQKTRFLVRLDYLFILCYTLFIVSFVLQINGVAPSRWVTLALWLSPFVGLFDGLENIQLLAILRRAATTPANTFQPFLRLLSVFTWIKWLATTVLMVLLAPYLWQQNCVAKGLALLCIVAGLAGVAALYERVTNGPSRRLTMWFAQLVLYTFALFALYVIVRSFM